MYLGCFGFRVWGQRGVRRGCPLRELHKKNNLVPSLGQHLTRPCFPCHCGRSHRAPRELHTGRSSNALCGPALEKWKKEKEQKNEKHQKNPSNRKRENEKSKKNLNPEGRTPLRRLTCSFFLCLTL